MKTFFNPASVVIIGASRRTGPGSFNIVENLKNFGYKGRVYAVNPKATEIYGVPCYARSQDLPEVPDLAVVTVPRELLPGVIRDACEKGIRYFTLVPQGLKEADEVGSAIQAEFLATLRQYGARALGPNTLGTVNTFDSFTSSFMPTDPHPPLGSSIICQTGLFLATDLGPTSGLGLGIDVGNQADIGFPEALKCLGDDPRVTVIAIHMEGLRPGEGRDFLEVARATLKSKPVLIYKTGRSSAGAHVASSHSGSLAGSYAVYRAAFESAGIISLDDTDDMDDSVKAFVHLPPMRGRRVAIVTVSGGGGIMAADACEDYGLELAQFTPETMKALRGIYPSWMEVGNPLDVWPAAIGKQYPVVFVECFNLVADDPNVDGIVCVGGTFGQEAFADFDMTDFLVASAERRDKPITWWLHGRKARPIAEKAEASRRIAIYPSPDRAVRAIGRLAAYYVDVKNRPEEPVVRPKGLPAAPAAPSGKAGFAPISPAAAGGAASGPAVEPSAAASSPAVAPGVAAPRVLGEEAFQWLEAYGIKTARWEVASTADEAARAAGRIGFPVVAKAIGPEVLHKSDLGLVRLNLVSPEDVRRAGADILGKAPNGSRLLVQEFLGGGHEVIIGSKRDPHFGPTVVFGLGGIFTEVLKDVAIGLAPLGPSDARRLVEKTKGYAILRGARGQSPADIGALVDALVRLSWLVHDRPVIAELDLNPVKVFEVGKGCAVVDTRVITDAAAIAGAGVTTG